MAREKQIGVAVIGILLTVFSGLLCKRLTRNPPPTEVVAQANIAQMQPPKLLPTFEKPVIVRASAEIEEAPSAPDAEEPQWASKADDEPSAATAAAGEPRQSFMPIDTGDDAPEQETPTVAQQAPAPAAKSSPIVVRSQASDPFRGRLTMPKTAAAEVTASDEGDSAEDPRQFSEEADGPSTANPYDSLPAANTVAADDEVPAATPRGLAASPLTARPTGVRPLTPSYGVPDQEPPSYAVPPGAYPGVEDEVVVSSGYTGAVHQGDKYVVEPNDSYWNIALKVYGHGGYFKAIQEHNRKTQPRPDRLKVGDVLSTPAAAVLEEKYPDLTPRQHRATSPQHRNVSLKRAQVPSGTRVYVVEEGDTLFDIARYELGKPGRWGEIYQLNRQVLGEDYDYLKPGLELLIPDDASRDPVTRRPGETFQR